ncbi:hypothetical protein ACF0H5_023200 [Mactra antiquata]
MSLVHSEGDDSERSSYLMSKSDEAELVITLKSRGRANLSKSNPVNTDVPVGRSWVSISQDNTQPVTNMNYQVNNNTERVIQEGTLPMETASTICTATSSELLTKSNFVDPMLGIKHGRNISDDIESSSDVIVISLDSKEGNKGVKTSLTQKQRHKSTNKIQLLSLASDEKALNSTMSILTSTSSELTSPTSELTSTSSDLTLELSKTSKVDHSDLTIERKMVHECVVCNERFKSITELFRHRVEHNEKVPLTFHCSKCEATFTEPLDLEQHQLLHIENRAFQCTFCQETFTTLHNFKCHLRIHNTRGPLVCNMCYQVFDKKQQFISHMDDHAWGNSNIRICHQCTVCKKYFSDSSKLKRHMLRHYMGKPYKCEICSKDFLEKHKLTRHMLTHTGVKEHVCPHCDKAFTLRFNLATHLKIHGNERRYQCHVCKRTFVQKVVLQRHLRIHQDYINDVLEKGSSGS